MELNGADIAQFHLTPLQGCLEALMKPAPNKALVTNQNNSINGVMVVTTPEMFKYDKRDLLLTFKITTNSLIDLQRELDALRSSLVSGVDGTGVNELYVPELGKMYRLRYVNVDKYKNFGLDGMATIVIKFMEPDPSQTQIA